jgi:hypothetical protein
MHNYLFIGVGGKPIPYLPAEREGCTNHGFVPLKGRPDDALQIPEARDVPALVRCLQRLNDPHSAYFTVGCETALRLPAAPNAATGYVEFAINAFALAADPHNYFNLFFNFHRRVVRKKFELPVRCEWELDEVRFMPSNTHGFTTAVWIVVTDRDAPGQDLVDLWTKALEDLTDFLCEVGRLDPREPRIY